MITIRELNQHDKNDFTRIMQEFFAYSGEKNVGTESIENLFHKAIDPAVNLTYVIALDDNVTIGLCSLTFGESSYKLASFAWLDDMFVAQHCRKRGVGLRLLEKVKQLAAGRHCSNILLGVGASDEHAQAFYRRNSFRDMPCKLLTLPLQS